MPYMGRKFGYLVWHQVKLIEFAGFHWELGDEGHIRKRERLRMNPTILGWESK